MNSVEDLIEIYYRTFVLIGLSKTKRDLIMSGDYRLLPCLGRMIVRF